MKRAILALTIAAIVGAGVYGLAASLTVTSSTLGAGSATVAACQSATINVTYDSSYSASAPVGYQATTVHLQHVDETAAKCGGKAYKLQLTGASNVALGSESTGTVPTSVTTDATEDITVSGVSASSVTGVHLTIAG